MCWVLEKYDPKKEWCIYIYIKIIKTLLIHFFNNKCWRFSWFHTMTSFFWGGPGSHFLRLPVRNPPKSGRWRRSSSRSTKRKSRRHRLYQEPPVVSSCIVARCNLCLVDGFSLCFSLCFSLGFCWVNETCCVFGLPRTHRDLYFSGGNFCSKRYPPEKFRWSRQRVKPTTPWLRRRPRWISQPGKSHPGMGMGQYL